MKLNAIRCDWCKKIYFPNEAWDSYKFWHVSMGGSHAERILYDQWEYDFCSVNCLNRWLSNFVVHKEVTKDD